MSETPQTNHVYDFAIVGGGAAGFSAGLYAARYLMDTVLFEGEFGGETATASTIENWPGSKAIDGYDLMVNMREQVKALDVNIVPELISSVVRDGDFFVLKSATQVVRAKTILLAIGAARRKLGLPEEDRLRGKGISYCTTCDSPLYKGKRVAVVGGGDASIKGVNMLAKFAQEIFVLVRKDTLRAEPINQDLLKKNQARMALHMLYETEVKEIHGAETLKSLTLTRPYEGSTELAVDGLMIEIGAQPIRELPQSIGVELDPMGFIKTDGMMRTNVAGVTAAGDCTNLFGHFKQDITASCEGAVAATAAHEFLQKLHAAA